MARHLTSPVSSRRSGGATEQSRKPSALVLAFRGTPPALKGLSTESAGAADGAPEGGGRGCLGTPGTGVTLTPLPGHSRSRIDSWSSSQEGVGGFYRPSWPFGRVSTVHEAEQNFWHIWHATLAARYCA